MAKFERACEYGILGEIFREQLVFFQNREVEDQEKTPFLVMPMYPARDFSIRRAMWQGCQLALKTK